MICHCDACHYTFDAAHFHCDFGVPTRCPDCGKKTVNKGAPAVRAATEIEIEEYIEDQRVVMEKLAEELDVRKCG